MSDERSRAAPSERFAAEHLALDLHTEAAAMEAEPTPKKHGHRQKTLFKNSGRTVALFVLDAGAGLAEHATSGIVTVQELMTRKPTPRHRDFALLPVRPATNAHDFTARR